MFKTQYDVDNYPQFHMFARCNVKFRRFKDKTFVNYKQGPLRMLTMVIRYMLWKHHGRAKVLGSFKPLVTQAQDVHFQKLYQILMGGPELHIDSMAETVHRILYHTITMNTDILVQVASIVDQSFILTMLTGKENLWHSFWVLTRQSAHFQRTAFTSMLHTALLGGIEVDYSRSAGT